MMLYLPNAPLSSFPPQASIDVFDEDYLFKILMELAQISKDALCICETIALIKLAPGHVGKILTC